MTRAPLLGALSVVVALTTLLGSGRARGDGSDPAADVVSTFKVEGMTSVMCEWQIKRNVKKLEGVKSVEAFRKEGRVEVTHEPENVSAARIATTITELGYKAELVETRANEDGTPQARESAGLALRR